MKHTLFLAALALTMAAPALADDVAPAKPANPYICLRYHEIDGWGSRDKTSMVVNDRFGRKYLLSLRGICSDIDFAMGVGIRPLGRAGFCVDRGDRVVVRDIGAVSNMGTCFVTKVQYYTKEMQAADRLARENKQPLATY
jgi:hypothetical protein